MIFAQDLQNAPGTTSISRRLSSLSPVKLRADLKSVQSPVEDELGR